MRPYAVWSTILLLLAGLSRPSVAQSPFSLSVAAGGGLLIPVSSSLKGGPSSMRDYFLSSTRYDVRAKVRVGFPALPFMIVGVVSYDALSDDAVVPVSRMGDVVNARYGSSLGLLGVGIGAEYAISSLSSVRPYVGAHAVMNFISGRSVYEDALLPPAELNSATRFGLEMSAGAVIDVPTLFCSIDVEASYHLANLWGKSFDGLGPVLPFGGPTLTDSYGLNDGRNPADPTDHTRPINYLTISVGLNFALR